MPLAPVRAFENLRKLFKDLFLCLEVFEAAEALMPTKLPRWKSAVGGANSQPCSYSLSGTAVGSKDRFVLPAVIVLGDGSGGFVPLCVTSVNQR